MKLLMVMPRYHTGDKPYYQYVYPLGIGYLTSVLKQAGHHVDCVNLNHLTGSVDSILHPILASKDGAYDFVLSGATSVYYAQVKDVVDSVRRGGAGAKVILGGGLISSEPMLMMDALAPEYLVLGEAEVTLVDLLGQLGKSLDVSNIPGIGYRNTTGGFVMTSHRDPIRDLDALPLPDLDAFEFAKVLDHMRPTDNILYYPFDWPRSYPLLTSRSCPYLCTFCYHPIGNVYRQRSVDSIMREIEENIPKYRINIISLHDELFSRDKERVHEFCRRFKAFRATLGWDCLWTCGMRVGDVDAELLAVMKDSGCFIIGYGFESFSEIVLQSMRKRITPAQIERAVDLTLKANIGVLGNFIFGDTAETLETARTTLDYWKGCGAAAVNLNFIIPFPGTAIYQRCLEDGVIKNRLQFIESDIYKGPVNCTSGLSSAEFQRLRAEVLLAKLKYSRLVCPRHQIARGDDVCDVEIKCPYCSAVMMFGNCTKIRGLKSCDMHCRCCSHHFFMVTRAGYWLGQMLVWLLDLLPRYFHVHFAQFLLNAQARLSGRRVKASEKSCE